MSSTITALTSGGGLAMAGDTSGQLQLLTNNGTAAVTVTTAQLVGVGTTSPSAKLHVSQVGNPIAQFTRSDSGTGLVIASDSDGPYFRPETSSAIRFINSAASSEWARFTSSGYFKQSSTNVYAYSGSSFSEFNGNANSSVLASTNQQASGTIGNLSLVFSAQTPNNTTSYFLECADTTNAKCMIYSSGTISNRTGTYNTLSDVKLKENIIDATPKLDKLMDVKVRNYNLIGDELKQIGFVAQELETVFPSLIDDVPDLDENKEPTGEVTKGVKLTVMIPILVKAIQELNAKVTALEEQVINLGVK